LLKGIEMASACAWANWDSTEGMGLGVAAFLLEAFGLTGLSGFLMSQIRPPVRRSTSWCANSE
jgi:hypothetical protein